MKRQPHVSGMMRRSFWNATLKDGVWSDWKAALVPDDYDDVIARRNGHISADYYGVAMMPAGWGMVGFIAQFRHRHPLPRNKLQGGCYGNWGETDVTLAYQPGAGERWLHSAGRPDFLTHGAVPWARNGWYLGSNVIDCGSEQRLYLTGAVGGHILARPDENTWGRIGFVSWPSWRLFEFRAEPRGELEIDLGVLDRPSELRLNFKTFSQGSVRVQILTAKPLYTLQEIAGRRHDDCVPLVGDKLDELVRWQNGAVIQPVAGTRTIVRLVIEHAAVYAYDVRPI